MDIYSYIALDPFLTSKSVDRLNIGSKTSLPSEGSHLILNRTSRYIGIHASCIGVHLQNSRKSGPGHKDLDFANVGVVGRFPTCTGGSKSDPRENWHLLPQRPWTPEREYRHKSIMRRTSKCCVRAVRRRKTPKGGRLSAVRLSMKIWNQINRKNRNWFEMAACQPQCPHRPDMMMQCSLMRMAAVMIS